MKPKDLQMKSIFDDVPERSDDEDDLDVPAVEDVIAPTSPEPKTYDVEDVEDVIDLPDRSALRRIHKHLRDRAHAEIRKTMKPPGSEDSACHFLEDAGTTIPPRSDDVIDPLPEGKLEEIYQAWSTVYLGPEKTEPFEPDPYLKGRIAEACPGDWTSKNDQKTWTLDVGAFFEVEIRAQYSDDEAWATVMGTARQSIFGARIVAIEGAECRFAKAARRLKPYVDAIRDFNEKVNSL